MRSPRLVYSLAAAAALLAAIPAASAIGQGLRGPEPSQDVLAATAAGSAFTYQGRLTDNGTPPTGTYDLRFVLYDAAVGGAQVPNTAILTKDGVPVVAGLFSVTLDFGATVFDGDATWIEVAVKPGASGQFTVLNPRQPVMPVPQALYARSAGSLAFPVSASSSAGQSLFEVTQLGTGNAITASRASESDTSGAAVSGSNAGGGSGVEGTSSHLNGTGVTGSSSGLAGTGGEFTGRTGLRAVGLDAQSVALDVNGALRASGSTRFAFVHTPSGANSFHNITWISSPLLDGDASATVLITQVVAASAPAVLTPVAGPTTTAPAGPLSGVGVPFAVAAVYIPESGIADAPDLPVAARGHWAIVRADGEFPANTSYNVVVIKQAPQ